MPDERRLLERWSSGDEHAAEVLLQRCLDPLTRFFSAKTSSPVEDLVQETLVRCVARRANLQPGSSFRAYMFTVARHLLYEEFKKASRRATLDPEATSLADLGTSPSSACARDQRKRLMQQALREIPLQSQLILELFYWEGLSVGEVADALDVPPGTVKSRLHRARGQLKLQLAKVGVGHPALAETLERVERWADASVP
ncbi:MAG: sigma-70 family RNA polymerase sigma factor [Myxococcota bacterium]